MSVKSSSRMRCLYCNQSGHSIKECKKDTLLFNSIDLQKLQKKSAFNGLDKKYLQRMAAHPKFVKIPQIKEVNMLYYNCRPISLKLQKKELINALHQRAVEKVEVLAHYKELREREKEKKDCPICYENMGKHTCTTTCGHEMCTGCFSKIFLHASANSGPSCPMCRASLVPSDYRRENTSIPLAEERERERQQWRELEAMEDNMERIRNHRMSIHVTDHRDNGNLIPLGGMTPGYLDRRR